MFRDVNCKELVIVDFGLAYHLKFENAGRIPDTFGGTKGYAPYDVVKTPSVDVFSMGVILFKALNNNQWPYAPIYETHPRTKERMFRDCDLRVKTPWRSGVSSQVKDLVDKMLHVNVQHRISMFDALQHEWFTVAAASLPRGGVAMTEDNRMAYAGTTGAVRWHQ